MHGKKLTYSRWLQTDYPVKLVEQLMDSWQKAENKYKADTSDTRRMLQMQHVVSPYPAMMRQAHVVYVRVRLRAALAYSRPWDSVEPITYANA